MGKQAKTRRSPKKSARATPSQKDVDVSGEVSEDEEQALATNTKGKDVVPSTPAAPSSAGPDLQLSHDSALAQILATLQRMEAEITQALRRQFVDAQSKQDLFSTLYSFTQKPTEPVWDFHCRFQRLLLSWPGQVSTEHQLAAFRNRLLPPWKKAVVSLGAKTLPEAFEIAERNELASQLEHEGKRKLTRDVYAAQVFEDPCVNDDVSTSTGNERLVAGNLATSSTASNLDQGTITKVTLFQSNLEILARLDKLIVMKEQKPKPRASALQSRPAAGARNSRAPDGRLVCYRCRQMGHLARDCPISTNNNAPPMATLAQASSQTSTSSTTSSGGRSN